MNRLRICNLDHVELTGGLTAVEAVLVPGVEEGVEAGAVDPHVGGVVDYETVGHVTPSLCKKNKQTRKREGREEEEERGKVPGVTSAISRIGVVASRSERGVLGGLIVGRLSLNGSLYYHSLDATPLSSPPTSSFFMTPLRLPPLHSALSYHEDRLGVVEVVLVVHVMLHGSSIQPHGSLRFAE